ncbi:Alpha/Beta hydrolase protein [Spinellus fusiger]|nr:Alpha/Beta hydrolase protein [Spinellus fusiger]
MKFAALASVSIGLILACSSVAHGAPRTIKRTAVLPPIIAHRASPAKNVPSVDTNAEAQALSSNPPLPPNVQTKGGYGVNATAPPTRKNTSFMSLPLASSAKVESLKTYMSLSSSAYCPLVCPGGIWSCRNCLDGFTLIRSFKIAPLDVNGYITRNDRTKEIQLVFRGSISIPNWVADLSFAKKSYPPVDGAEVHSGFYDSYISSQFVVVPIVLDQLDKYPSYRVLVTGHSLGGAIATVATLDLYQRDIRLSNANLFAQTYGGPRVGDANFAYYFSSTGISFERTVNNRDLVPHLPPQKFGFLHAGVEYWIDGNANNVRICDTSLDSRSCSNSIVPFTSMADHVIYFGIVPIC